ncbi:MAG: hypothetical protein LUD47_00700 [Clostridia bacterium]|nr:hypothetical protein [Clostridia bacterium]
MKKLCKALVPAVCAAMALTLCLAGCAGSDEYNAKDLSDAGVGTLAYGGSFTLRKTETEVSTFSDKYLTEEIGTGYGLTESYDAEGGEDVRLETASESYRMLEKSYDEDMPGTDTASESFTEERRYFVPDARGSAEGTEYLYTMTGKMEEPMTSASHALAEERRLSDDLETFGIRFSDFTFREMYTAYLEDILIYRLDAEEDSVSSDSYSETTGKKSDKVTCYEFTAECAYYGDFDGRARIALSFTIEGGLLMCINFNLYQERVTDLSGSPFTETIEYELCCDVEYSYDNLLMLTEREKEEYYSG